MASADPLLSYSSVRAYLECPLRWKFLYVDGLKEAPRGYFSFGRTVHAALEELLRPLVPAQPPLGRAQTTLDGWPAGSTAPVGRMMALDALLEVYRSSWVSEGYSSTEEEERYRRLGAEILTAYYGTLERSPPHPVAIESHLETRWDGIRIHGYVDRIDETPTGGLDIVDYKTSRELSQEDARESDQLALYQVLVERNFHQPVESLTLYHLRFLRPLSVPPRPKELIGALHDRVVLTRDGIRSEAFEPTPGRQCPRCDFRSLCPEFKEVPEGERERLAELVDRFARLRNDERRIDEELRSTAQELHDAAQQFGVHRIPGHKDLARRKVEARWTYEGEDLPTLLKELGLSEKARADDPDSLHRLLNDRTVDPELRSRLAGRRARRVQWYWDLESDPAAGS